LALDEGGGSIIYAEGYDPANFGAASLWIGARDGSADDINSSVRIVTYDPAGTFTELASFNRIPTADDFIYLNAGTQFANSADILNNNKVSFYDFGSLNKIVFGSLGVTLPGTYSVYLPNSNTTLAGLATTQTFTGTNTFNTLTNFGAGISSAGGTFSALTRFTAGISAAGGITFGGTSSTVSSDTGYRITSSAINAQTGTTYTFLATDNGEVVTFNNASAITVTIPTGLPVGYAVTAIQLGAGQVGFTAASGVTLNSYSSAYKIAGQHGAASLISYTTNVYNVSGSLNP
jgi:hypothetical protein